MNLALLIRERFSNRKFFLMTALTVTLYNLRNPQQEQGMICPVQPREVRGQNEGGENQAPADQRSEQTAECVSKGSLAMPSRTFLPISTHPNRCSMK